MAGELAFLYIKIGKLKELLNEFNDDDAVMLNPPCNILVFDQKTQQTKGSIDILIENAEHHQFSDSAVVKR